MKMKSIILPVVALAFLAPIQKANAYHPTHSELELSSYAGRFWDADDFNNAWFYYDTGVKKYPLSFNFVFMRGRCAECLKCYMSAIDDFNASLNLADNDEDKGLAHYFLAAAYSWVSQFQLSDKHLVISAKLGNGFAKMECLEMGIPY